jgi:hypothetical protein
MKQASSPLLPQRCNDHILSDSPFQESDLWENLFLCDMELHRQERYDDGGRRMAEQE